MTCEFKDGLRVSYCGPLRINKEDKVNVFLDRDEVMDELPPEIKGELLEAALKGNCNLMGHAANEIIEIFGTNIPE